MGKLSQLSPTSARTVDETAEVVCGGGPIPPPLIDEDASTLRSSSSSSLSTTPTYKAHAVFTQELMDKYDAFILDQFGVLHNGQRALPGAIELVEHLCTQENKKLIVLSNTSAPAHKALLKLPKLGFDPNHFVGMVTSGEEASRYIRQTFPTGSKALMFTWDTTNPNSPRLTALPQAFLEHCGQGLQVARTVDEADFLLLHGSEAWYRGDDDLAPVPLGTFIHDGKLDGTSNLMIDDLLRQCLRRGLPCVCANPDVIVQNPNGDVAYMPGGIAQRYVALGGHCRVFGKPEPEHFQACLRTLGLEADRVAHVGDSLHHDICGAQAAGVDNVFVTGGIHLSQLVDTDFGELPTNQALDDLFAEEGGIVPTHVIPAFRR